MKTNYFLKSLVLIALMVVFTNAKAVDIPVADGSTDTELAAALNQAQTGDVILINGWVTINAVVDVNKNVTIKAGVDNAGFDGGGNTRLFDLHPDPIDGVKLVFRNLGFMGGNGAMNTPDTGGGAARVYGGGSVEFAGCWFDGNEAIRGGVFFVDGGADFAIPATSLKLINCEATNNVAKGGGGESRGGYLFVDGNANIDHEYCKISSNQSIGGRGGALCLFGAGTRRFYYTSISSNKAGNWTDEEVPQQLDENDNVITSGGEYEGGVAFVTGGSTIFESCGIIDNQSWSHAAIIRSFDNPTFTFINSTLSGNRIIQDGRAPIWTGDATYTFVNSLMVENSGVNSGNGAGFDADGNANVYLNVFNSVFARNYTKNGEGAVDVRAMPNNYANMTVKNSIIGLIQGNRDGVVVTDNPNIPTKSLIDMYKTDNDQVQLDYAALDVSGINFDNGIEYTDFDMPYYLLTAGSTVTKLGDPALLEEYDVNTDLFERERIAAADGSITAAPIQEDPGAGYDDSGLIQTDIVNSKAPANNIRIIGAVENGILGVDFGAIRGQAHGQLLSISGQVVENVFDCVVVGKGYYNVHVPAGIYLLRIVSAGNTYVQKVFVK